MATLFTLPKAVVSMCCTRLPLLAFSTSTPTTPATQMVLLAASKAAISEVTPVFRPVLPWFVLQTLLMVTMGPAAACVPDARVAARRRAWISGRICIVLSRESGCRSRFINAEFYSLMSKHFGRRAISCRTGRPLPFTPQLASIRLMIGQIVAASAPVRVGATPKRSDDCGRPILLRNRSTLSAPPRLSNRCRFRRRQPVWPVASS